MKFTCSVGTLRHALSQARTAIAAKPTLLARGGALLAASSSGKNPVRVTGSNDHVTMVAAVVDAKVAQKGEALFNPTPVTGFLSTLPEGMELTVEASATHLSITRGKGQPYTFVLMSADYPDVQSVRGTRASVNFTNLMEAVDAVKRSAGDDAVVQLKSQGDVLTMATTDNYRLSQAVVKNAGFGDFEGILQLPAIDRVARIAPEVVTFDKKAFNAVSDDISITVRALSNASFPELTPILSRVPDTRITMARAELLGALQRLHAVDHDASVSLAIDQESMALALSRSSTSNGVEDVPVAGGPSVLFLVSLNLKFFLDAVQSHKAEQMILGFSGPRDPVQLRSTDNDTQVTTVLMPLAEGAS